MSQFIQAIATNPWVIVAGLLISLLGFILAIYFYIASKTTKGISYNIISNNLFSDLTERLSDLSIRYQGVEISTLTVSKVTIWNHGNSVINRDDISTANQLQISMPSKLLEFSIEKISRDENLIILTKIDDRNIKIGFDYLAKSEGFVVNCIHTAKGGSKIEVTGTIKGFSDPKRVRVSSTTVSIVFNRLAPVLRGRLTPVVLGSIAIITGILFAITPFLPDIPPPTRGANPQDKIVSIVIGLIYLFMGLYIINKSRNRIPRALITSFD